MAAVAREKDITPMTASKWEPYATYATTGQFGALDKGYVRHCGPTAIANLLMTFENRYPLFPGKRMLPKKIFRRIALLGRERHYYFNMDRLKILGGTFNAAAPAYIRRAAALYQREDLAVGFARPSLSVFLKRALDGDAVIYLETILHKKYGNHHLLLYGYREREEAGSASKKRKITEFLAADGWSDIPVWLGANSIRTGFFHPVKKRQT